MRFLVAVVVAVGVFVALLQPPARRPGEREGELSEAEEEDDGADRDEEV